MKTINIFMAVLVFTFFLTIPSSAFEYSLSVRTTYMQGCFLDDPPDFANNSKVFLKMKRCLCMMDKFEARYSEKQFMDLFDHADKNYSWQKRELDDFVKESMQSCLKAH